MTYLPILKLAAQYANEDPRKPHYLQGSTFREPNLGEKLELWFDATEVDGAIKNAKRRQGEIRSENEVYDELARIVRDSVQRALTDYEEGNYLAGLIVKELRNAT